MSKIMAHIMMIGWCSKLGSLYKMIECCTHTVLLCSFEGTLHQVPALLFDSLKDVLAHPVQAIEQLRALHVLFFNQGGSVAFRTRSRAMRLFYPPSAPLY